MIREVHLDPATDQEVEAVRAVFRAYGFDPELKDDYARRSTGVLPWIIIVTLGTPILAFLRAFGAAVGTAAGQDAYPAFKNLVKDLWASRAGLPATHGAIEFEDSDNTRVILTSGLPDKALDALLRMDLEEHRGEYLVWDEESGIWRDPTRR
jgi:hypothetical protein